jgi:hypothetical protein
MIRLTKGETQTIYFTGTENALLLDPYFLFVFVNRVTQETVKFVATNTSTTSRVDSFSLAVNSKFADSELGMWSYFVYEQASSSGTDTTGKHLVESGYMNLSDVEFVPTSYNEQSNIFLTYNG